jgi:hypothetical protein
LGGSLILPHDGDMQASEGVICVENELLETIRYIKEREEKLSRYSDKLRRAVESVFDVFGDPKECQLCGFTEDRGFHKKYYYYGCNSKALWNVYGVDDPNEVQTGYRIVILEQENPSETIAWDDVKKERYVYVNKNQHKFTPKIFVSIDVEDGVPFYVEEREYDIYEYYLAFSKHKLVIALRIRGKHEAWSTQRLIYGPHEVSRECLKALVKSGRLLEFLRMVAEKLQKMNEEYGEVSEIAEKMAKAVEG